MESAGLRGETILCFAPDPWAGLWRNRHQIMTRLARHNTVVYVEPRMYLGQALRAARAGKLGWAELRAARLRRERDNLYIYRDPPYAPYAGRLSGGRLTAAVRRRAMRQALQAIPDAAQRPILWLLRPFHADQIGQYREKLIVYHVTDEYSGFPTVTDKAAFRAAEEALLRRADVVIVTSKALLESKGRFNECTFLVPNAVDYQAFQVALGRPDRPQDAPLLDSLARVPHPRIGYVGALNEKIDFDLLAAVARTRPDWQLVLVGGLDLTGEPHKADALSEGKLPNVHWIGSVPVEQVPLAIAAMDVCLLPYVQSAWTAAIDSLKLYEYLAVGRPVVATDVPAAQAGFAAGLVRVALRDAPGTAGAQFTAQIDAALLDDAPEQVARRRAALAGNTWDDRVGQIEQILANALRRGAR